MKKTYNIVLTENDIHSIVKRIILNIMNEDRIVHDDDIIEIDNFDLVKRIMNYQSDDDVYFVQIIKRKKDNPNMYFAHNACDYLTYYLFKSIEEFESKKDEIKTICKKTNSRAYIYLNKRSADAVNNYATNVLRDRFLRHRNEKHLLGHEVEFAAGQSKDWPDREICFLDIDSNDENIYKEVVSQLNINNIKPLATYRSTNNGWHIILPNKEDAKKLDFRKINKGIYGRMATVGLEIDKPSLLYCYLKPFGYDKQEKWQKRHMH